MFNDATTAALDIVGNIFIGVGILFWIWLTICFIHWLLERSDSRRFSSLRFRREKIATRIRAHKTLEDMLRTTEDCAEHERRSREL
jgi:hypothetical protein